MKQMPELDLGFGPLYKIMDAPIKWYLLKASLELNLFDLLEKSANAAEVAQKLKSHLGNTEVLLNGLASSGLLRKKHERFQNSPLAQTFLVKEKSTYLGDMLLYLAGLRQGGLENIKELVLNGPPEKPVARDLKKKDIWNKAAVDYLANYQRAGIVQQAVNIISALPEWPDFEKVLDLGGGPGLIGMGLVLAHPKMTGVLFDLPKVVEVAEFHIQEYGLNDRMSVIGGDYNTDSFGQGYDLVWASLNLYYARNDFDSFMRKIFESIRPGGVFVSYHEGLTNERTLPEVHVVGRISPAFMGQDFSFEQGFIAQSMAKAGFRSVNSRTIETENGLIDLDIARK